MYGESRLVIPLGPQDHVQGPACASVELVEYGDYQCPLRGKAFPTVKRLLKSMNGVLKSAFRNFPLTQCHPEALDAAKAAEAAAMQGRFWQMHDMLYENQEYLDYESLLQYALELRMDVNRFVRDFRSHKVERKILADFESGIRSGLDDTPAFFINGILYEGDFTYPSLFKALQPALEESKAD